MTYANDTITVNGHTLTYRDGRLVDIRAERPAATLDLSLLLGDDFDQRRASDPEGLVSELTERARRMVRYHVTGRTDDEQQKH